MKKRGKCKRGERGYDEGKKDFRDLWRRRRGEGGGVRGNFSVWRGCAGTKVYYRTVDLFCEEKRSFMVEKRKRAKGALCVGMRVSRVFVRGVMWGVLSFVFVIMRVEASDLRVVTTTSLDDSGIVQVLLEAYEKEGLGGVRNVAVGSGAAFVLGRRGDADLLIVHEREGEESFLAGGYGVKRYEWIRNDFILLGDESDKAGLLDSLGIEDAFRRLARRGEAEGDVVFVSRGDKSGTHKRELDIQMTAGVNFSFSLGSGYVRSGQGMGASLNMADNWGAYILTDRGSWLNRKDSNRVMKILVEGGVLLENPYSVMILKSSLEGEKRDQVRDFVSWLFSREVRVLLEGYRLSGEVIFFPSGDWPTREEIADVFGKD